MVWRAPRWWPGQIFSPTAGVHVARPSDALLLCRPLALQPVVYDLAVQCCSYAATLPAAATLLCPPRPTALLVCSPLQPMVAGIAALISSVTRGKLTGTQIANIIQATVDKKSELADKCKAGVRRRFLPPRPAAASAVASAAPPFKISRRLRERCRWHLDISSCLFHRAWCCPACCWECDRRRH